MVATDMNELDCEAFIGILIRKLPSKSQTKKGSVNIFFFTPKQLVEFLMTLK